MASEAASRWASVVVADVFSAADKAAEDVAAAHGRKETERGICCKEERPESSLRGGDWPLAMLPPIVEVTSPEAKTPDVAGAAQPVANTRNSSIILDHLAQLTKAKRSANQRNDNLGEHDSYHKDLSQLSAEAELIKFRMSMLLNEIGQLCDRMNDSIVVLTQFEKHPALQQPMGLAASISGTICSHLDKELSKIQEQQKEQSNQLHNLLRDALLAKGTHSDVSANITPRSIRVAVGTAPDKPNSAAVHTAMPESTQLPPLEQLRAASESPRGSVTLASTVLQQQSGSLSAREAGASRVHALQGQVLKPLPLKRFCTKSHQRRQPGIVAHEYETGTSGLVQDFQGWLHDTGLKGQKASPQLEGQRHISAPYREQSDSDDVRLKCSELPEQRTAATRLPPSKQPPANVLFQHSNVTPEANLLASSARAVVGNMQMGAPPPLSVGGLTSACQRSTSHGKLGIAHSGSNASQTPVSTERTSVSIPCTTEAQMQVRHPDRSTIDGIMVLAPRASPNVATTVRMGIESPLGGHVVLRARGPERRTDLPATVPHH